MVWLRATGGRALALAALGALFALLLRYGLSTPEKYGFPNFYMEEGYLYFKYAFEHGWAAIAAPHRGYYAAVPTVATALAAHSVPLAYAAHLTTGIGLLVCLATFLAVFLPGFPLRGAAPRFALCLVLSLSPLFYSKTHTTYAHVYAAFLALLLLLAIPAQRWERPLLPVALACAGVASVMASALAPVAWGRWLLARNRGELAKALILSGAAAFHAAVFFSQSAQVSDTRLAGFGWDLPFLLVGTKVFAASFGGLDAMEATGRALYRDVSGGQAAWGLRLLCFAGAALVVYLLYGPGHWRELARRRVSTTGATLLFGFLALLGFGYFFGETHRAGKAAMLVDHHRYFAAPNAILATALFVHASRAGGRRARRLLWIAFAWVAVASVVSLVRYEPQRVIYTRTSWKSQIERWDRSRGAAIRIVPQGVVVRLEPERVR